MRILLFPLLSTMTLLTPALLTPTMLRAQGAAEPWDVSQAARNLAAQAARLQPLLAQLTPQDWQSKGAPATYVAQLRNARDEVGYLVAAATNLGRQPDKLTIALETYFRMQSVESQVTSLVEGVRHYQNPAVGDLIVSVMAANSSNRDQLREYISDLAQTREQEYKIVDNEAQRCRGVLLHQPAARPASAAPATPSPSLVPSANQPNGSR
jgi:hypothetical protein